MRIHHLHLLSYCNSQEKQFSKGILVRKVTVLWSETSLEPCHQCHGAFMGKMSTAKSLTTFTKSFIIDAWMGSKCTSDDNCC